MTKVAALGVAIDLGHLSLSTGSSKVMWNNCHRHLCHAFPEYSSVTLLHAEIKKRALHPHPEPLLRRIMSQGTGFFMVSISLSSEFQFRN